MIQVMLFATLAELAGERSVQLEMPSGTTVRQVWDLLQSRYPRLAGHSSRLLRSVNGSFANPDTPVNDGDEVAFFPPVSGG
jgi:molybdopterin converting factor subunit 1